MSRDDEVFDAALDLPATERAAFLDRVCAGDAAMRARVAALLAGYDSAENFMEQPAVARPRPVLPEEKPGDVIGRYTLIRKLGEGGCGVVYLAEQTSPVRRNVALKVIKLGMDTRQVIARFEAERQALAMMDHPDIARVFDAGATETGRPFFVMEFVDGVPVTKFCDEHRLSMARRLELFARICLALQHAHQKGIVHRDLKPSNVLVALHDGVPSPKVIDFGIAKATQGRLTEQTLITGFEQFMGTPAYMSPEQAGQRDVDIDTRSDVYSLGVLLYELLAGRPPYDPQSLVRAGVEEIRRIIREVEPPRPSTRVSTLADADRATIARLRRAAPVQLTSVLRGDLDWIVMRCMEKDRERRYGTAQELAEDVRRHLRREPVLARPPQAWYRFRKFVARHRVVCASVAAVATALIVGTVVSVRQAVRATRAEVVARKERDAAEAATRAEAVAREDAQRRQEQAENLLTFMLGDFRAELRKLGKLNLLDAIGDKAMAHFAALDPADLTDTALNQQARAITQIGETRLDQGRYAEAVQAFESAYRRTAMLCTRHPQDADMLFERAQAEYWIGFAARRRGDFVITREWFTRYRDSALALRALEGPTPRAAAEVLYGLRNLAVVDYDTNQLAAAAAGFRAEREAREKALDATPADFQQQADLAEVIFWEGTVAEKDARYDDAAGNYRSAKAIFTTLSEAEPGDSNWPRRIAECHELVARLLAITGRLDEAQRLLKQAIALLEPQQDSTSQDWRSLILAKKLELARVQAAIDPAQGLASAAELRDAAESLFKQQPRSRPFIRWLAQALLLEASRPESQVDESLALALRARELLAPLTKKADVDNLIEGEFARACVLEGRLQAKAGQPERARECWLGVVALLEARAAGSRDWRVLDPLAQALVLLGRDNSAQPLIQTLKHAGYRPIDPDAATLLHLNH